MARNDRHDLQPRTGSAGISRRLSVLAAKKGINRILQQRLHADFKALGDGARAEELESYRLWSGFSQSAQDRMWRILAEQVDEDYDRIRDKADKAPGPQVTRDPDSVPTYQHRANIHGQPGGYMLEREPGDLAAGILYEAGGNIYALGQGIGGRDSKGQRLIAFLRERFPDLEPKRILEMGCAAGGQTVDYAHAFPDAELHAIDLSPGMLNYARARTALMGGKVQFHQKDAGNSGFEDGSFDLIVSHNLFHEVDGGHMQAIADESFRLLGPDGLCIHQDVPIQTKRLDPFTRFISAWQRDHNDEPFWMDFSNADLPALLANAGFERSAVFEEYLAALDGPVPWYVVGARRAG